jgi:hypothetical protein
MSVLMALAFEVLSTPWLLCSVLALAAASLLFAVAIRFAHRRREMSIFKAAQL